MSSHLQQFAVERVLIQSRLKLSESGAPGEGLLEDKLVPEQEGERRGEGFRLDVVAKKTERRE